MACETLIALVHHQVVSSSNGETKQLGVKGTHLHELVASDPPECDTWKLPFHFIETMCFRRIVKKNNGPRQSVIPKFIDSTKGTWTELFSWFLLDMPGEGLQSLTQIQLQLLRFAFLLFLFLSCLLSSFPYFFLAMPVSLPAPVAEQMPDRITQIRSQRVLTRMTHRMSDRIREY